MAASANQLIVWSDDCRKAYPGYQSTHLYQGTLAFINSTGYLVGTTGSGVNKFAGILINEADNGSGSSGDINGECYTDGEVQLVGSGFSQATVGKAAFATDNFTVGVDGTASGAVRIGTVTEYISATLVMVRLIETSILPAAALTAALTTITHTAPGTPDYAVQDLINSSAYGFVTKDEGNSVLKVVANLQVKVNEIEAALEAAGLAIAN